LALFSKQALAHSPAQDAFLLTCVDGAYNLSYQGKYWTVDRDGVAVTSATPVNFFFEFVERSKFLIKHADSGKYLEGEQAGGCVIIIISLSVVRLCLCVLSESIRVAQSSSLFAHRPQLPRDRCRLQHQHPVGVLSAFFSFVVLLLVLLP
jgi:hypothetical protein